MPGFDISGHCFMLIFANLIMSEEAVSYRYWPMKAKEVNKFRQNEFERKTKTIRNLFLLMFVLNILWDFQIIITSAYYHTMWHKFVGAIFALSAWALTYKFWYCRSFPYLPIRRHKED